MLNKSTVFTITYLFDAEGDKYILTKYGEIPAKSPEEADHVLASDSASDLETMNKVIDAVQVFKDAEPGSEESITRTLEELENEFGFSIAETDELVSDEELNSGEDEIEIQAPEDGEAEGYSIDDVFDKIPEPEYTDPTKAFESKTVTAYDPINLKEASEDEELDESLASKTQVQNAVLRAVQYGKTPLDSNGFSSILHTHGYTKGQQGNIAELKPVLTALIMQGLVILGAYAGTNSLVLAKPENTQVVRITDPKDLQIALDKYMQ